MVASQIYQQLQLQATGTGGKPGRQPSEPGWGFFSQYGYDLQPS
jgi:hypothetical protein